MLNHADLYALDPGFTSVQSGILLTSYIATSFSNYLVTNAIMKMEKWRASFYCLAKTQIVQVQEGRKGLAVFRTTSILKFSLSTSGKWIFQS